jgi:very-short-patch-repair endonuclease
MMLRYWYRLYHQMTPAEVSLEPALAALGERYRVQHPFLKHKHFADFALLDRKRIIEVDGDSHDKPSQKYKDLQHMIALKADGWDVVRVSNEQALANPGGTVAAALLAIPQTAEQLQSSLRTLTQNYPELLVEKPKKTRRRKSPKKAKAPSGGKRGGARRRRPEA